MASCGDFNAQATPVLTPITILTSVSMIVADFYLFLNRCEISGYERPNSLLLTNVTEILV
jgi:hypothetical protein